MGSRVSGKVALVTGGARGIGKEIALALIEEGALVFITDIDGEGARATAALIHAESGYAHDVVDEAQWRAVMASVIAQAGRIDILVNNAGVAVGHGLNDVENVTLETWTQIINVNGYGTLLGCRHALAAMQETGGGAIVNIASIVSINATPTLAPYGFSKAGVAQLTKSVALLGEPLGVRCNSVHPGIIRTAMIEEIGAYHVRIRDGSTSAGAQSEGSPVRFQTPRDVAMGVLFLASDEARGVTGTQLLVDGGTTSLG